jgi:murein DD-endopeptidase MepM/ murein hydrolase activator NlpD
VDYAIPYGREVRAAISGWVSYAAPVWSLANPLKYHALVIDPRDGTGYKVMYLHLSSYFVPATGEVKRRVLPSGAIVACAECPREGQFVSADLGDLVGYTGDYQGGWGKVAPHLHFEVAKDGIPVDPYGWRAASPDPYERSVNYTLWDDLPPPVFGEAPIAPGPTQTVPGKQPR